MARNAHLGILLTKVTTRWMSVLTSFVTRHLVGPLITAPDFPLLPFQKHRSRLIIGKPTITRDRDNAHIFFFARFLLGPHSGNAKTEGIPIASVFKNNLIENKFEQLGMDLCNNEKLPSLCRLLLKLGWVSWFTTMGNGGKEQKFDLWMWSSVGNYPVLKPEALVKWTPLIANDSSTILVNNS